MISEVLTTTEMARADQLAADAGVESFALMVRAGEAVAAAALARFPAASRIAVLVGPGNNGGDGYVAAGVLAAHGLTVAVFASGPPRKGSDADRAADTWPGKVQSLDDLAPAPCDLIIDALYGAGLNRALAQPEVDAIAKIRAAGCAVLAVDVPSGLSGDTGAVLGDALAANVTATFFRKKPGHLLYPGRQLCGELVVADIGIPRGVLSSIGPVTHENRPELWAAQLPHPGPATHKYSRGHTAVLSGGPSSTGAARLSAKAAARVGAGAVTVLSPGSALQVNAAHLTSTMVRRLDDPAELGEFLESRKVKSVVCGPGFGLGDREADLLRELLARAEGQIIPLVLDADALTLCSRDQTLQSFAGNRVVLTPHEGDFARLFPDLTSNQALSKLDRAREASARSDAFVVYKGADTVIAAPDGRAVINANDSAWLATAGSGDVLAGAIAGLLGQGMAPFEACCAAVWCHAEAGSREGFGLIAEDLPQAIRGVLAELIAQPPPEAPSRPAARVLFPRE